MTKIQITSNQETIETLLGAALCSLFDCQNDSSNEEKMSLCISLDMIMSQLEKTETVECIEKMLKREIDKLNRYLSEH